jgi:hypothetical protein
MVEKRGFAKAQLTPDAQLLPLPWGGKKARRARKPALSAGNIGYPLNPSFHMPTCVWVGVHPTATIITTTSSAAKAVYLPLLSTPHATF